MLTPLAGPPHVSESDKDAAAQVMSCRRVMKTGVMFDTGSVFELQFYMSLFFSPLFVTADKLM